MTVIRGSYNATWNSLSLGNTEVGFRQSYSYRGRPINFDAVGETPVDVIFAGVNMMIDTVLQEYDAPAVATLRWPFHATLGQLAPAGQSLWELARPLILSACNTGTDPATIVFYKAILAPDFDLDIEYSHKERPLPLRMQVMPIRYEEGGEASYGTPLLPSGCNDLVYFTETYWP